MITLDRIENGEEKNTQSDDHINVSSDLSFSLGSVLCICLYIILVYSVKYILLWSLPNKKKLPRFGTYILFNT